MPSQLAKSRLLAFRRQGGLCLYCGHPVWLDDSDAFRAKYLLTKRQHALRRCTAEHLIAKQDGGNNRPENIAAACGLCNRRRHQRPHAPDSAPYQRYVQSRVRQGKWLTRDMTAAFAVARTASADAIKRAQR